MKKYLLIFCMIIGITLSGCASTGDVVISETSKAETIGNVSFNVPDNWERKDVGDTTYFYTPNGDTLCYSVDTFVTDFDDVTEEYMQGIADALKNNATSVEIIENNTPYMSIDDNYDDVFYCRQIKYNSNRKDYIMGIYALQKNNKLYQFLMTAQGNDYVYDDAIIAVTLSSLEVEE